jgi:signal transduction histidine kinase
MSEGRWSLRTRITALCGAAALLLALIAAGAALLAAHNRGELDDVFNKITPLRAASDELVSALLDQETGVRGYAATGAGADLAEYHAGRTQEGQLTAQLAAGLADRPAALDRLRAAQAAIADWQATVAEPIIAKVRGGDRPAAQAVVDDAARAAFDRVRASLAALQDAILAVRTAAVDRSTAGSGRIVQLLVAAGLVVLLTGVLLAVLLRHLVASPVARLAGDVRVVAAGDYDHPVRTDGPPELASLAGDVDRMRHTIVNELTKVTAARAAVEEANRQLEAQAAELTRSNRDLEEFAYVAAHDLQEPLRKVASFCQLLQRRYAGQLDERADQYIGFAVDGAQRMQRLINDLLAFSRIGRITAGFVEVDLNAVLSGAASQHESVLARTGGEISWDPLPVVCGEEALLAALISNLVGNSIKFRQPDVPPRVHVSARQVGDAWEFSCRDNGIGIDPEFGDKVFVIFQRLPAKGTYPGTGIGLAIAKKIVEHHGGRIWVAPSTGPGADLRFTLPAQGPAETPASPAPAGPAQTGSAQAGTAQTGSAQTGSAQTGSAQTGTAQTGPADADPGVPARSDDPSPHRQTVA